MKNEYFSSGYFGPDKLPMIPEEIIEPVPRIEHWATDSRE